MGNVSLCSIISLINGYDFPDVFVNERSSRNENWGFNSPAFPFCLKNDQPILSSILNHSIWTLRTAFAPRVAFYDRFFNKFLSDSSKLVVSEFCTVRRRAITRSDRTSLAAIFTADTETIIGFGYIRTLDIFLDISEIAGRSSRINLVFDQRPRFGSILDNIEPLVVERNILVLQFHPFAVIVIIDVIRVFRVT